MSRVVKGILYVPIGLALLGLIPGAFSIMFLLVLCTLGGGLFILIPFSYLIGAIVFNVLEAGLSLIIGFKHEKLTYQVYSKDDSVNTALVNYIAQSRNYGQTEDIIFLNLKGKGWTEKEILSALRGEVKAKKPKEKLKLSPGITTTIFFILVAIIGAIYYFQYVNFNISNQDKNTLRNINSIEYQLENYYLNNKKLPKNLTELNETSEFQYASDDSFKDIKYSKIDSKSYKLCATFLASSGSSKSNPFSSGGINLLGSSNIIVSHPKGLHCFNKQIRPYIIEQIEKGKPPSTATIVSPKEGQYVKSPVTLVAKVVDPDGDRVRIEIQKWNGINKVWEYVGTTKLGKSGSDLSTTLTLNNGGFTWQARGCDEKGNCGSWSAYRGVYVTNLTIGN